MRLTLPWPHRNLSPNGSHGHWAARAKAKKHAKADAFFLAISAGVRIDTKATSATVEITFHPPDRRRRDADNALASCKAALDGVAAALGVDDSKWRLTINPMGEPTPGGSVVLQINTEIQHAAPPADMPDASSAITAAEALPDPSEAVTPSTSLPGAAEDGSTNARSVPA